MAVGLARNDASEEQATPRINNIWLDIQVLAFDSVAGLVCRYLVPPNTSNGAVMVRECMVQGHGGR